MENKKYKDMSNTEIRKITFESCPCKCTTCSEACGATPVGACREHLSKKFDQSIKFTFYLGVPTINQTIVVSCQQLGGRKNE